MFYAVFSGISTVALDVLWGVGTATVRGHLLPWVRCGGGDCHSEGSAEHDLLQLGEFEPDL